jgi:hypothetical protein
MVRRGTLLFYERSLSDVLSELDVRMKNEIDSIGKNLLLTEGVDVLCDRLEEKYRVNGSSPKSSVLSSKLDSLSSAP